MRALQLRCAGPSTQTSAARRLQRLLLEDKDGDRLACGLVLRIVYLPRARVRRGLGAECVFAADVGLERL